MDDADLAGEFTERERAHQLTVRRPEAPRGMVLDAECCLACGLSIPAGRRESVPGTAHCAECAGFIEEGKI